MFTPRGRHPFRFGATPSRFELVDQRDYSASSALVAPQSEAVQQIDLSGRLSSSSASVSRKSSTKRAGAVPETQSTRQHSLVNMDYAAPFSELSISQKDLVSTKFQRSFDQHLGSALNRLDYPKRTDYTYSKSTSYRSRPLSPTYEFPRLHRRMVNGSPIKFVPSILSQSAALRSAEQMEWLITRIFRNAVATCGFAYSFLCTIFCAALSLLLLPLKGVYFGAIYSQRKSQQFSAWLRQSVMQTASYLMSLPTSLVSTLCKSLRAYANRHATLIWLIVSGIFSFCWIPKRTTKAALQQPSYAIPTVSGVKLPASVPHAKAPAAAVAKPNVSRYPRTAQVGATIKSAAVSVKNGTFSCIFQAFRFFVACLLRTMDWLKSSILLIGAFLTRAVIWPFKAAWKCCAAVMQACQSFGSLLSACLQYTFAWLMSLVLLVGSVLSWAVSLSIEAVKKCCVAAKQVFQSFGNLISGVKHSASVPHVKASATTAAKPSVPGATLFGQVVVTTTSGLSAVKSGIVGFISQIFRFVVACLQCVLGWIKSSALFVGAVLTWAIIWPFSAAKRACQSFGNLISGVKRPARVPQAKTPAAAVAKPNVPRYSWIAQVGATVKSAAVSVKNGTFSCIFQAFRFFVACLLRTMDWLKSSILLIGAFLTRAVIWPFKAAGKCCVAVLQACQSFGSLLSVRSHNLLIGAIAKTCSASAAIQNAIAFSASRVITLPAYALRLVYAAATSLILGVAYVFASASVFLYSLAYAGYLKVKHCCQSLIGHPWGKESDTSAKRKSQGAKRRVSFDLNGHGPTHAFNGHAGPSNVPDTAFSSDEEDGLEVEADDSAEACCGLPCAWWCAPLLLLLLLLPGALYYTSHSPSTLQNLALVRDTIVPVPFLLYNKARSAFALGCEKCSNAVLARLREEGYGKFADDGASWTPEQIRGAIAAAIAQYDADKTGLADHALEPAGGIVLGIRCTETYAARLRQESILGIPLWSKDSSPRTVIQPGVVPGECWSFKGEGHLVVQLSGVVQISKFSYEHIPVEISPDGHIESAPKQFDVYGLTQEYDPMPILLGSYVYDRTGPPLQTFILQNLEAPAVPIIEIHVRSNHGHPNYTCLYRFRVHGKRIYPAYGKELNE